MRKRSHFWTFIVISSILAIVPLGVRGNGYLMHLLIMALIWSVVAAAWDVILGYAGIFNLAQIGFFALGAYASGMLAVNLGVSPWLGLLAGAAVGGLAGVLIGLPCLRLKGIYVALMTLAFFEVIGPFIVVGREIGTGGKGGLQPIPPFSIGSYRFSASNPLPWYYVAFGIFFLSLFVIYRLINSRFGMAFIALRDQEPLAQSLGVNRFRSSLILTAVAAALTGLTGAFYAHYVASISPRLLGLENFLFLLIMVIFGGAGNYPGAVIGAFAVTFLNDALRPLENFRLLVLGALLVLLIILLPQGLMGTLDLAWGRLRQGRLRQGRLRQGRLRQGRLRQGRLCLGSRAVVP
jgi:branched-chain amino acid transport system permease protein